MQGRLRSSYTSFSARLTNTPSTSCVSTIEVALSTLTPPPYSVDVSIVLQSIRVRHSPRLDQKTIELAINNAGFDIESPTLHSLAANKPETSPKNIPSFFSAKQRKHIAQCSLCQSDGTRTYVIPELPILGRDPEIPRIPTGEQGPATLSLSVGGMTCAACSNTLTRLLSEVDGVADVVVDLMGHSARVVVESQKLTPVVVETIEDAGFEAEVVKVDPLARAQTQETATRTISLKIDGMYCE